MSTQPEALRLAEKLDEHRLRYGETVYHQAAAELRRLHAENASLAAALASSCDEQRHELWESGGIAGCERARVAERQRDALLEALKAIEPILARMYGQQAADLPPMQIVRAAIAKAEAK